MFLPWLKVLVLMVALVLGLPETAVAERASLLGENTFFKSRDALIPVRRGGGLTGTEADVADETGDEAALGAPSLFIGKQGASLFARAPVRNLLAEGAGMPRLTGTPVERIRQLIGHAESRRHGYDAVQHGARIRPSKRPTDMTLAEIYQWIDDTPGQPHAIGRYQFIPPTLRSLVKRKGIPLTERFSPMVQDVLADVLLVEAGLLAMRSGAMERHQFMNNLAKIWAGFPNSSGKSHYHGYAGNKASMTWAHFDAEMDKIFPG